MKMLVNLKLAKGLLSASTICALTYYKELSIFVFPFIRTQLQIIHPIHISRSHSSQYHTLGMVISTYEFY